MKAMSRQLWSTSPTIGTRNALPCHDEHNEEMDRPPGLEHHSCPAGCLLWGQTSKIKNLHVQGFLNVQREIYLVLATRAYAYCLNNNFTSRHGVYTEFRTASSPYFSSHAQLFNHFFFTSNAIEQSTFSGTVELKIRFSADLNLRKKLETYQLISVFKQDFIIYFQSTYKLIQ